MQDNGCLSEKELCKADMRLADLQHYDRLNKKTQSLEF
jgi:hypothetical protein